MIDLKYIEDAVSNIVSLRDKYEQKKPLKSAMIDGSQAKDQKRELPDYFEGYRQAAEWLTQIKPHAQKGYFPDWLFENNSPNQTDREKQYTEANFRQPTIEVFKDYVDTMARAYHDGNYSITWPVEANQYVTCS